VASGFSRTLGSVSFARLVLALGVLPSALTLVYEWTTGDTPSNAIRALAGAPLGAAVAFLITAALQQNRGQTVSGSPSPHGMSSAGKVN
jgi:hypothetical protein